MPKGNFPKLKCSICNVSFDTADVSNVLSRSANSNSLVVKKLKRKLTYSGHVYFEAVWPELLNQALMYVKKNNQLYSDVGVAIANISDYYYYLPMMIFRGQVELLKTQKKLKFL